MTLVDPMHAVYMGVGKRLVKEFQEEHWDKQTLAQMQRVLNDMPIPGDVCRTLYNWAANLSSLHASQMKAFLTSLSIPLLRTRSDWISDVQWHMWLELARAARLLSSPYIIARKRRERRSASAGGAGIGLVPHADHEAPGSDSDSRSEEESVEDQRDDEKERDDGRCDKPGGRDDPTAVHSHTTPVPYSTTLSACCRWATFC
jgi:hypothetical protein